MVAAPDRKLTGSRCLCRTCGEYFNSSGAFTSHRVGPWTNRGADRRCLTVVEMRSRGWALNEAGFWVTSKMPASASAARHAATISGGASGE